MTICLAETPGAVCDPASAVTHVTAAPMNMAASRPNLILMLCSFSNCRGEKPAVKPHPSVSIRRPGERFVSAAEQTRDSRWKRIKDDEQDKSVDRGARAGPLWVERRAKRLLDPVQH